MIILKLLASPSQSLSLGFFSIAHSDRQWKHKTPFYHLDTISDEIISEQYILESIKSLHTHTQTRECPAALHIEGQNFLWETTPPNLSNKVTLRQVLPSSVFCQNRWIWTTSLMVGTHFPLTQINVNKSGIEKILEFFLVFDNF